MTQPPADPETFTISTDLGARLIRVKVNALWSEDTFLLYELSLVREMEKFQRAGLPFDMLGDALGFPAQPQQFAEQRQELLVTAKRMGLRKSAIVGSPVLAKLQVRRLLGDAHRFFNSEEDALAWLKE